MEATAADSGWWCQCRIRDRFGDARRAHLIGKVDASAVCLRGDTDFALTANFDRWAQQVEFVLGTDSIAALRSRAEALPQTAWKRLERPAPYDTKAGTTRSRRHTRKQEVVA
jgi:hypothetical protein